MDTTNKSATPLADIRIRLAEAHWKLYVSSCRELSSCSHIPDTFAELSESEQAYHYRLADVLLSLPGIAIVELPELDSHWATWQAVEVCDGLKVIAKRTAVLVEDEETLTSHPLRVARALAAALLAAANAAEAK